ncbi:nitroreductase family deazaflavin-dependent oxidoreductase [Actinomadura sp. KC06]|uniref:nitroreductase family deazaflavin-dependent oxidoreductase n=1 Tax=Actinomadura sp. KC06 TaxID=2530369 RepID=UPI001051EC85|nr:nitroreductase family deazaflavin-dependent oxidoreductase [Actinomadura sp. KC06]TDD36709.1 nitroreductase family deazaflavin-dependent oxidoreductase [Actinomadura sp. KC06]
MLYGKEHVARYQETDGEEGHEWRGTVTLLLTTTGRHTRKERTTPLIYQLDGDAHIVVASDGGADDDPLWYKNIQADPEVKVQVKGDKFTARARTATQDEKPALWAKMTAVWPDYDVYQTKTSRDIPVVILERV